MFVDEAVLELIAGTGGSGCMSFKREKYVSLGGPDGGDGGKGGDIIFVGHSGLHTLVDTRYSRIYSAKRGVHGKSANKKGKAGSSVTIPVPIGTVIHEDESVLGEIMESGQRLTVVRGGRGGRGNTRYVSPTDRAPRKWEPGLEGERKTVTLELKLLADIGLVGFPNAGKSTLISVVSAARPKIADYPFTTLVPNLGIVKCHEFHSFVIADIPGLIEGAHTGKGLGDRFLRHIERTSVLMFLIEITDSDPVATYKTLSQEIEKFNPAVLKKAKLIILTKQDLDPEADIPEKIEGIPVLALSAVGHTGLTELKERCCTLLDYDTGTQ